MAIAQPLVWGAEVYLVVGGLVALAFLLFGLDKVDHSARGSYLFRPLIAPGLALLWPLVMWRWRVLSGR